MPAGVNCASISFLGYFSQLSIISENFPVLCQKIYLTSLLLKKPLNKTKTEALAFVRAHWLGEKESNLHAVIQSHVSYH